MKTYSTIIRSIVTEKTSKAQEKDNLLSILIKLRVKHQRGEITGKTVLKILSKKEPKPKIKPGLGNLLTGATKKDGVNTNDPNVKQSLKDGRWILMQDWTNCDKKCGNGTSYQQWVCVPPEDGGKPCQGESVKTKHCNTHPCPSVNALLELINKDAHETKEVRDVSSKPIVKVGVFSSRPQRYSKCIIKENDAFMMITVKSALAPVRKPIRIIMNNLTVSMYNDDTYEELNYSYDVQKVKFTASQNWCCFHLEDTWRKDEICGYKEYCGAKDKNVWADGWRDDVSLFKHECKQELPVNHNDNNVLIIQDIQDEIEKKASEAAEEVSNIVI